MEYFTADSLQFYQNCQNLSFEWPNDYFPISSKNFGDFLEISEKLVRAAGNLKCICDALRYLVPLVQFKRREKHPWRSVNFSKVAG